MRWNMIGPPELSTVATDSDLAIDSRKDERGKRPFHLTHQTTAMDFSYTDTPQVIQEILHLNI